MPSARAAIGYESYLIAPYLPGDGQIRLAAGSDGIWVGASVDTPGYFLIQHGAAQAVYSCTGSAGEILTGVAVVEGRDQAFPAGAVVRLCTAPGGSGGGGGSGTVTSVSVATANGYSGTVANPTTTPAITIVPPTLGVVITQHSGVVTTDTPSAGAVTCDLSASDAHQITMSVSTLITLSNPATSKRQAAILYLIQGGSGSCVPTFTPSVSWGTAGTPVWSTVVGKVDIVVLDWNGTSYRGAVVGLGY